LLSKIGGLAEDKKLDKFVLLNLTGDEIEKINGRTNIYFNKIKKDNDILQNKPAKGRGRGERAALDKVKIPIPESFIENMPIENVTAKQERSISDPTIGCFTILNTQNKMNCADMSQDGAIVACGFKDGLIFVWVIDRDMDIEITGNYLL
jgi:hypothetical protein